MAHVAAQLRQRDEDLARIGDEIAVAGVAQFGRGPHQRREIGRIGERQSLVGREPRADAARSMMLPVSCLAPPGRARCDAAVRSDRRHPASGGIASRRSCVPGVGGVQTGRCESASMFARATGPLACAIRLAQKCARSAGLSISNAMPGRRTIVGSMPRGARPRRDAGRNCRRRSAAAPHRAATSGPRSSPVSSCDGAIVKDGAGRCAASSALDLGGGDERDVAGQGQHAAAPSAAQDAAPRP